MIDPVDLGLILSRPLRWLLFRNATFAWWASLAFCVCGVAIGIGFCAGFLGDVPWWGRLMGLAMTAAYALGLYGMNWLRVHGRWSAFCELMMYQGD